MKVVAQIGLVSMCAVAASAANAGISDADAANFIAKYNCQACHTVDKKLVGPAFHDVAKKYVGHAGAEATLEAKVTKGSTGV